MNNKVRIYCGDKTQLPEGRERFGTRYECLQCGFGAGAYGSKNKSNKKSKGCLRPRWPKGKDGYDVIANQFSPTLTFSAGTKQGRKQGLLIGKRRTSTSSPKSITSGNKNMMLAITFIIWLVLSGLAFVLLYKFPLKFFSYKSVEGKNYKSKTNIHWKKFGIVYSIILAILTLTALVVILIIFKS